MGMTPDEFMRGYREVDGEAPDEKVWDDFKGSDSNQDGYLQREEFWALHKAASEGMRRESQRGRDHDDFDDDRREQQGAREMARMMEEMSGGNPLDMMTGLLHELVEREI